MSQLGEDDAGATRKPRDAAATRRRLLEAAEDEFAAHGFQGARMRHIAAAAGVQPGLIHHHFVDKQGLYRAMLERALGETSHESWQILGREPSLEALIDSFVTMLMRFNQRHQNLATILRFEANSGSAAGQLTVEVVRAQAGPVVEAVKGFVALRQKMGELRPEIDATDLVLTALGLCSYPFSDRSFIASCLPDAVIDSEERFEHRRRVIVETMARICR